MFSNSAISSVEFRRLVASTIVESSITALRRSLLSNATSAYRLNKSSQIRVFSSSVPFNEVSRTPTGSVGRPRSQLRLFPFLPEGLPLRIFSMETKSAADRERVVEGKSVELGGRRVIHKKN